MSTTATITKASHNPPYRVSPQCAFKPLRKRTPAPIKHHPTTARPCLDRLPLRKILPSSFSDMYAPEVLQDKRLLTPAGRPSFTQRAIVDWEKNDTRSLLILDAPRPEWRDTGRVPQVVEPGFRVQILPLTASDDEIIQALVSSDLYKEHAFEQAFLLQTAIYTVQAARARQTNKLAAFTKPEWRNIIENYLLNLACEAQCRLDFEKICAYTKRQKKLELGKAASCHPSSAKHSPNSTSPLLRKAVMTCISTSPEFKSQMEAAMSSLSKTKVTLSKAEKQQIWVKVQADLYARLDLNWQPDELI